MDSVTIAGPYSDGKTRRHVEVTETPAKPAPLPPAKVGQEWSCVDSRFPKLRYILTSDGIIGFDRSARDPCWFAVREFTVAHLDSDPTMQRRPN